MDGFSAMQDTTLRAAMAGTPRQVRRMPRSEFSPAKVGEYDVPAPLYDGDDMARFRCDDLAGMDDFDLRGERISLSNALAATRRHDVPNILIAWPNNHVTFNAWGRYRMEAISAELSRRSGRRRP